MTTKFVILVIMIVPLIIDYSNSGITTCNIHTNTTNCGVTTIIRSTDDHNCIPIIFTTLINVVCKNIIREGGNYNDMFVLICCFLFFLWCYHHRRRHKLRRPDRGTVVFEEFFFFYVPCDFVFGVNTW